MKRRHQFKPEVSAELERRIALSTVAPAAPSLVRGFFPGVSVRAERPAPVTTLVERAFASFTEDYAQARGIYYASLADPAAGEANRSAFVNYTQQRVNVLAQELASSMIAGVSGRSKGQGPLGAIPQAIGRQINARMPNGVYQTGTLARALIESIPASNVTPATATLFAMSQDNAIEAARVGVLNGVGAFRLLSAGGKNGRK